MYVCIHIYIRIMYVGDVCECVDNNNNNACVYGICAFCWYIKDKTTVRKMHGMERFKIIGVEQTI